MIAHRGVTVACSGSSALCSRLRGNASARALGNKRRDVKISSSSQGNLVQQTEAALNLLRSAAVKKDVSPEAVEEAMLQVESTVTEPALGIDGKWRLVFSTSTKLRVFQYIPVIEDLVIDLSAEKISLESAMGPFQFLISGVTFGFDQDKAALDFQFKDVEVLFLGKKVWQKDQPGTKAKTYTFFYADPSEQKPNISIARSSAGGLSLLLRDP